MINYELLKNRAIEIWYGPLSDVWWMNGKEAVDALNPDNPNNKAMEHLATGFLSQSSLQKLKFEMKAKVTTDPLGDFIDPIVDEILKFGASKNVILKHIMKRTNNDPISLLQNILLIAGISSSSDLKEAPTSAIKIPVYETLPFVSAPMDQPIDIEFRYGYKGLIESYNAKECVVDPINNIIKELPKVELNTSSKDAKGRPDPKKIEAHVTISLPTKPGYYANLLKNGKDLVKNFVTAAAALVKPQGETDKGADIVNGEISNLVGDLLSSAQNLVKDMADGWNRDNVIENVISMYNNDSSYAGDADYDLKIKDKTNDEGELETNSVAYSKILSYTNKDAGLVFDTVKSRKKRVMKFAQARRKIFGKYFDVNSVDEFTRDDTQKINGDPTGNKSYYDLSASASDSAVYNVTETILGFPDKLNAAALNSMKSVNVFVLRAIKGKLLIGPFLPEQCSWSYDLSQGLSSDGYPLAATFTFSKIETVIPGVKQFLFDPSIKDIYTETSTSSSTSTESSAS